MNKIVDRYGNVLLDASGGEFELIEEITVESDTDIVNRVSEPNGTPYNFSAAIMNIVLPNVSISGRLRVAMRHGSYGNDMLYSDISVSAGYTVSGVAENNHGMSKASLKTGVSANYMTGNECSARVWENINRIFTNGITIPKDTVIKIYGIRA